MSADYVCPSGRAGHATQAAADMDHTACLKIEQGSGGGPGEEELIEPPRGWARVSVMNATVRITGDGASVDGHLVEVPAGL